MRHKYVWPVVDRFMADFDKQSEFQRSGVRKALTLIESLRHTASGELLYGQISRILGQDEADRSRVEQTYAALLSSLLQTYARQSEPGSLLQVQLMMLDKLLQPPLSSSELDTLQEYIDQLLAKLALPENQLSVEAGVLESTLAPLFAGLGMDAVKPAAAQEPVVDPRPTIKTATPPQAPVKAERRRIDVDDRRGSELMRELEDEFTESNGNGHRSEAPETALAEAEENEIQALQDSFSESVSETSEQAESFGGLLEDVFSELKGLDAQPDIGDARQKLMGQIERMMVGHRHFSKALDTTNSFMREIEDSGQQLTDELTRVRLLSMTDELTQLPNRRAFLRRLEDEVGRVQRYGVPLALTVIDLDHFKQINDKYGHAAGDSALQAYAREILSRFRHHDFVARYGGEEFVVLLPNTTAEGARRSLVKVQGKARSTTFKVDGQRQSAPRFSAGVAIYQNGETPSSFIERADHALYQAKRLGRDRIEIDDIEPPETEATDGAVEDEF